LAQARSPSPRLLLILQVFALASSAMPEAAGRMGAPGARCPRRQGAVCSAAGAMALVCGLPRLLPAFLGAAPAAAAPVLLESAPPPSAGTWRGRGGATIIPAAATAASPQAVAAMPHAGAMLGLGALLTRALARRHRCRPGARSLAGAPTAMRATSVGGDGNIEDLVPFQIRGFSLATLVLIIGALLLVVSFYLYLSPGGGNGLGSLLLIYAVPVFLLGASLAYAQLDPIEIETDEDAEGIWELKSTPVLQSIKSDITRHRYGDDAHLDSSLKTLGLTGPGRYPQLKRAIVSKTPDGEMAFTLIFESKEVPFTTWSDPLKLKACDRFFGPGVYSEISKFDSAKRWAALKLTTGERPKEPEKDPSVMTDVASGGA